MYTRLRSLRDPSPDGEEIVSEVTSRGRSEAARVVLAPLSDTSTFADRAYTALKDTIVSLNIYEQ